MKENGLVALHLPTESLKPHCCLEPVPRDDLDTVPSMLVVLRSSQCSTTGVTKAAVCVILSVGCCI